MDSEWMGSTGQGLSCNSAKATRRLAFQRIGDFKFKRSLFSNQTTRAGLVNTSRNGTVQAKLSSIVTN